MCPVLSSLTAKKISSAHQPISLPTRLSQPDAVEVVPLRHVGKNHFVPDLQTTEHFDRVHRCAAQFHVDANGFAAIVNQLEDANRAVGLTVYRAPDIENVPQVLDF